MSHRSTSEKAQSIKGNSSPIYESAYDLRKSPPKEGSTSKNSSYNNNGFISD